MAYTTSEQLEHVQQAIYKIETSGVSVSSILGRSITRASISVLYDRERYLKHQIKRESQGGGIRTFNILNR